MSRFDRIRRKLNEIRDIIDESRYRRRRLIEQEDLSKYGIKELRDGLTLDEIKSDYTWILDADIENAIIGEDFRRRIVWYDGTWYDGTWETGIWENGTWKNGIWKNGTWEDGAWFEGVWDDGVWLDGTWYDGIWNGGTWKGGVWKGGRDKHGKHHPAGDSPDKW